MAKMWKKTLALAMAMAAILLLSMAGCGEKGEPEQEQSVEEEQQLPEEEPQADADQDPQLPQFGEQIQEAREKNEDIIGWLKIDDTEIDGAVVQGENNQYYERLNEWKQYSWTGSYFADYECNFDSREDLSKNTVIYGHNVHFDDNQDGERFSQLFHCTDMDFAEEHPYIYFSIFDEDASGQDDQEQTASDGEMVWEIFAVFYTTTDFDYIRINKDFRNPEEGEITDAQLMNIITGAQQRSEYVYDVPVNGEDKILTLSTCSYQYGRRDDVRFVVMAKLLDQGDQLQETASLRENTSKIEVEPA